MMPFLSFCGFYLLTPEHLGITDGPAAGQCLGDPMGLPGQSLRYHSGCQGAVPEMEMLPGAPLDFTS